MSDKIEKKLAKKKLLEHKRNFLKTLKKTNSNESEATFIRYWFDEYMQNNEELPISEKRKTLFRLEKIFQLPPETNSFSALQNAYKAFLPKLQSNEGEEYAKRLSSLFAKIAIQTQSVFFAFETIDEIFDQDDEQEILLSKIENACNQIEKQSDQPQTPERCKSIFNDQIKRYKKTDAYLTLINLYYASSEDSREFYDTFIDMYRFKQALKKGYLNHLDFEGFFKKNPAFADEPELEEETFSPAPDITITASTVSLPERHALFKKEFFHAMEIEIFEKKTFDKIKFPENEPRQIKPPQWMDTKDDR